MSNYLRIIILLSTVVLLNGCVTEMVNMGHYAYEQTRKMFRQPVKCVNPKYNLYLDINKLDLKERYELAAEKTGCFTLLSSADIAGSIKIKPVIIRTENSTILEVRAYRKDNILDLNSYPFDQLNLQERIEDSIADIYATLKKFHEKDHPQYAESH